jgi:primosomal protein N' (replication factor Y) (superfamily II helicase)
MHPTYAEIALQRRVPGKLDTFTYKIPEGMDIATCHTVLVPFRNQKIPGVVVKISKNKPSYKTKEILEKITQELLLRPWQLELANFISAYYLCSISKVMPLFLPKRIWNTPLEELDKKFQDERPKIPTKIESLKLTVPQAKVLKTLEAQHGGNFLLHGVTGSGKTEIYVRLAKRYVLQEKQALILVPEIALTPQLIEYFEKHFPERISVIHSSLTEKKRTQSWLDIFHGRSKIIIGSRSALFAPFKDLGLIVMDEEHEWTYKQEQTPRYHARDVATKMAELTGATFLMGSATPSIESYYKALQNDYTLLELHERASQTPLPNVTTVDMRDELSNKNFGIFSDLLREKLAKTLAQNQQSILFINRRGFAPAVMCRDCGFTVRCRDCHVAMVLHKRGLLCHHCGKLDNTPTLCPSCDGHRIRHVGLGTQRVEEEIQQLFSLAKICRADSDTIKKREDYEKLYKTLKNHETDILIGTQMIAKGLDLPQVQLASVVLADTGLHFPDFRASERTFQLLTQVAGRSGRREDQGEVVIQTYHPDNYAIKSAAKHDYHGFYAEEIKVREDVQYPPFTKIIELNVTYKNEQKCIASVHELEAQLIEQAKKQESPTNIVSTPAPIPKTKMGYHYKIILRGKDPRKILAPLMPLAEAWRIDVDPL